MAADPGALLIRRAYKRTVRACLASFRFEPCVFYQCLLNGCGNLEELDLQPAVCCPVCLRKVMRLLGISTTNRFVERFHAVRRTFNTERGSFAHELRWMGVRIAGLEKHRLRCAAAFEGAPAKVTPPEPGPRGDGTKVPGPRRRFVAKRPSTVEDE